MTSRRGGEWGGTEQARAMLWELSITDSETVLRNIVNMCRMGSPSDDADLETALELQQELYGALEPLMLESESEEGAELGL